MQTADYLSAIFQSWETATEVPAADLAERTMTMLRMLASEANDRDRAQHEYKGSLSPAERAAQRKHGNGVQPGIRIRHSAAPIVKAVWTELRDCNASDTPQNA